MNRIKNIFIPVILAATVFSATYLICDLTLFAKADSSYKSQSKIPSQNKTYMVKEHEGKISVFEYGEETPIYILDSPYVRDLPEYDRELLKHGIVAESAEELNKILEDYDY